MCIQDQLLLLAYLCFGTVRSWGVSLSRGCSYLKVQVLSWIIETSSHYLSEIDIFICLRLLNVMATALQTCALKNLEYFSYWRQ